MHGICLIVLFCGRWSFTLLMLYTDVDSLDTSACLLVSKVRCSSKCIPSSLYALLFFSMWLLCMRSKVNIFLFSCVLPLSLPSKMIFFPCVSTFFYLLCERLFILFCLC